MYIYFYVCICKYGDILAKKKVTLSVESKVYDKYRKFCEENAILLSKKVELFMRKELEKKND